MKENLTVRRQRSPWKVAVIRQLEATRLEVRLQFRNGLYAVYLAMTAVFLVIVALLPPEWRETGLELIILFDPTVMGFFFAGGLVLLERDQGIPMVVVTSRGGFETYRRAKVQALFILAFLVTAALIAAGAVLGFVHPSPKGMLSVTVGLALSIPVYFNLGVIIASWKQRVMEYFIVAGVALLPLMIPLPELLGIPVGPVAAVSPLYGTQVFITATFGAPLKIIEGGTAIAVLLVWNAVTARWAARRYTRFVGGGSATQYIGHPRKEARSAARVTPLLDTMNGLAVDVRLMLRDKMILVMLGAPFLAAAVIGRGVPALAALLYARGITAMAAFPAYIDNLRSFVLLLGPAMYGIAGAFLILEEKDSGVVPFLKTVPGRRGWYITRRGVTLYLMHWLFIIPIVFTGKLYVGTPFRFALSLVVDSLVLPGVFLLVAGMAKNKVQGLALAKIVNILTVPPLLMIVVPERWVWVFAVIPSAWGTLIRQGL